MANNNYLRGAAIALLPVFVGCSPPSDDSAADAQAPPQLVELDVAVRLQNDRLTIQPREVARPCECDGSITPLGSCVTSSDVPQCDCSPPPGSCLQRFALTRDGVEVTGRDYEAAFGSSTLQAEGLLATDGNVLVLEGCGGRAEIPLPTGSLGGSLGNPVITDVTVDLSVLPARMRTTWTGAEEAVSSAVSYSIGFTAESCHNTTVGTSEIFVDPDSELGFIGVTPYTDGQTVDMALGTATIYRSSHSYINSLYVPGRLPDGRYSLRRRAYVSTDDELSSFVLDVAAVDLSSGTPLVELSAELPAPGTLTDFDYIAGPTTDTVRIKFDDLWYASTLPHVAIDQLFWPALDVFELEIPLGSVELVNTLDPADTRTENLTITWHVAGPIRPASVL